MIQSRFETLLKKIDPRLRIRVRNSGDIAGVFLGVHYICRLTLGEIELRSYNHVVSHIEDMHRGDRKRGRIEIIAFLKKFSIIKNHQQVSMLMWGI